MWRRLFSDFIDRVDLRDLAEAVLGWAIFSVAFWDRFMVFASAALHAIVLISGGLLGLNGLWRTFVKPLFAPKKMKRRAEDREPVEEMADVGD